MRKSYLPKPAFAMGIIALGLLTACSKPEDRLAGHIKAMGKIFNNKMDNPKQCIQEVRGYVRANLPDAAKSVAELAVEMDKIDDNSAKAERLKKIIRAIKPAAEEFAAIMEKLEKKVRDNEEWESAGKDMGRELAATGKIVESVIEEFQPKRSYPRRVEESESAPALDQ